MTNSTKQSLKNKEEAEQKTDVIALDNEFTSFVPIELIKCFDNRTSPTTVKEEVLLECVTKGANSTRYKLNLKSQNLRSLKDFRDTLSETIANLNIQFKEKEFTRLKQKWFNEIPNKEKYLCPGHQNNLFIGHNFTFDYSEKKFTYFNKNILENSENAMMHSQISADNTCIPKIYDVHQKELFGEFFENFIAAFKSPIAQLCFGASLAILYWDVFQLHSQGFPSIFLTGESHAGKTTMLQLISSIFGLQNISSDATGGNSTLYAMTHNLSTRFNIPVFIEELPMNVFDEFEPLVKNTYSGIARHKGKKDGMEKMKIFTSFIATSNHFFAKTPAQLLSRILFANMKKEDCNFEKFPYFNEESRKELSSLLPIFLSVREQIFPIYTQTYAKVKELIPKVESRHLSNIAIGCSMWNIINKLLEKEIVDWQTMALKYHEIYENYLNAEICKGDTIINDIAKLLEFNELHYGYDYKLVDKSLKLNLNRYIAKYNIKNSNNLLNAKQFRLAVENDKRFDCKTVPLKGINRAISIDLSNEEYLFEILVRERHHWSTYNKED